MMPTGHLPYSLQEGPGSPAYTHWLCGSNIRSHCSSSRPIGPRSHLCHRKGSPEKCSVRWNTWRRSHCTSFLKRARHECEGRAPCNSSVKARKDLNLTVDPGRLIPLSKSLRGAVFVCSIYTHRLPGWLVLLMTLTRDSSWEPNSSLTCSQTFEVQRQFVRVVGTVRVAIALPLRAEKTAPVPTAKFLWSTGTIDWRKRKTAALLLQLAATSF